MLSNSILPVACLITMLLTRATPGLSSSLHPLFAGEATEAPVQGSCADEDQFQCDDEAMQCISRTQMCDGYIDCTATGTDEGPAACLARLPVCPQPTDIICGRGADDQDGAMMAVQCINASDICDGRQQCSNGMDEAGCCQPGHFRCPIHWGNISPRVIDRESSVCLSPRMTCDGIIDCPGGEDESEALCRSEVDSHMPGQPDPCPEQGYVAAGIKCCVPSQYICDGHADCLDGADERNCSNVVCEAGVREDNLSPLLCSEAGVEVLRILYSKATNTAEIRQNWQAKHTAGVAGAPATVLERGVRLHFKEKRQHCCNQSMWRDGQQFILIIPKYSTQQEPNTATEAQSTTLPTTTMVATAAAANRESTEGPLQPIWTQNNKLGDMPRIEINIPCGESVVLEWRPKLRSSIKRHIKHCRYNQQQQQQQQQQEEARR